MVIDANFGEGLFDRSGIIAHYDWNNTTPDASAFEVPSYCPS